MNKAKMTFRFDHNHNRNNSSGREIQQLQHIQHKVIPLHQDEYRVGQGEKLLSDKTPAAIEQQAQRGVVSDLHDKKLAQPLIDAQPLNQYTNDFGGWQSSFDIETQRVEKLIRESSPVNAVNGETGYMDRQHYMDTKSEQTPEDEPLRDHRWYVPEETVYIPRTSDSSWWKVFASVTGAVVTGVAFGFFVLSMFSGDTEGTKGNSANPAPAGQTAAVSSTTDGNTAKGDKNGTAQADKPAVKTQADKAQTAIAQADKTAASNQSAAPVMAPVSSSAAAVTAVTIPAKSYSFLQSGIFSTSQGAETAVAALKKKGITAVSDKGEKYPVYAGIALTRDDAAVLAKQLQQKKTDVIIKNVELPALSKIKWTAKPSDALQNYIAQGDKLLQLIASLTLSQLTEAKLSAVSADALQSVKTAQQSWSGMSAASNEGLLQDARASVQKMGGAMNAAVSSMDEYKKNASTSSLWQTQEALMQYVLAQKELRKSVEAE